MVELQAYQEAWPAKIADMLHRGHKGSAQATKNADATNIETVGQWK